MAEAMRVHSEDGAKKHRERGAWRIATAGWTVPRIHQAHFPTEGSHLARYSAVFDAVEINTSFYRPHRRSTYERWAASTPDGFRFCVKAPKAASHDAGADFDVVLDAFFSEVAGLGSKLGAILIQLPPTRRFDAEEAERLLRAFRRRTQVGLALEPRHASWFAKEPEALLVSLKVARAAADPSRAEGADRPGGWRGLTYHRLHGSPIIYRSAYGEDRLQALAQDLRAARKTSDCWCVFDNTTLSAAAGDALQLRRMLR
jgi:uncharacterized protein YecE (DUF72 family)